MLMIWTSSDAEHVARLRDIATATMPFDVMIFSTYSVAPAPGSQRKDLAPERTVVVEKVGVPFVASQSSAVPGPTPCSKPVKKSSAIR